ncbi:MAG: hypothetical protein HYX76_08895, partial [Acidobacteria bacterium]|nr:hypothetical protein [Acidobacteriota bacterium]
MRRMSHGTWPAVMGLAVVLAAGVEAADRPVATLAPLDIFDLEFVSDPQISPDGRRVAYVRRFA